MMQIKVKQRLMKTFDFEFLLREGCLFSSHDAQWIWFFFNLQNFSSTLYDACNIIFFIFFLVLFLFCFSGLFKSWNFLLYIPLEIDNFYCIFSCLGDSCDIYRICDSFYSSSYPQHHSGLSGTEWVGKKILKIPVFCFLLICKHGSFNISAHEYLKS